MKIISFFALAAFITIFFTTNVYADVVIPKVDTISPTNVILTTIIPTKVVEAPTIALPISRSGLSENELIIGSIGLMILLVTTLSVIVLVKIRGK